MRFHPFLSILLACTALAPAGANAQAAPAQSHESAPAPATTVYRNTQYGFCFVLPASWKGFTIVTEQWQGGVFSTGQTIHGPRLLIRNPQWAEDDPYQDIPIMVFTPAQWRHVEEDDMSLNPKGISPAKLGQNGRYVFALQPLWVGYVEVNGWQEMESWMSQNRLQAPCGNNPAPIATIH